MFPAASKYTTKYWNSPINLSKILTSNPGNDFPVNEIFRQISRWKFRSYGVVLNSS